MLQILTFPLLAVVPIPDPFSKALQCLRYVLHWPTRTLVGGRCNSSIFKAFGRQFWANSTRLSVNLGLSPPLSVTLSLSFLPSLCDVFPQLPWASFLFPLPRKQRMSLSKCFLFPITESNSQGKQGKRKKEKKKMPWKFLHIFQDPLVTKIGFFSSCRCLYRHRCCNCCCCKAAVSGMRLLSGHSQEEDD